MTYSFFKSNSSRRLFAVVALALFLTAARGLYAQNQGFYFGGAGGYAIDAFASEGYSWGEWENKFQQAVTAFLFFGVTFTGVEVGVNIGIEPRTYYLGNNADSLESTTFTHIPAVLKIGYAGGNNSLSIKPYAFGGMALDLSNGTPEVVSALNGSVLSPATGASMDWRAVGGAGIDMTYAFPGDHIALFIGGTYNLLIPVMVSKSDVRLYHYPQFNAGIIIHPFGGGGGKNSRSRGSSGGSRGSGGGGSYGARPSFVNSNGGGGGGYYTGGSGGGGGGYGYPRQGGQNFGGEEYISTDNALLADLRQADLEHRERVRQESDALLNISRDDGRREEPKDAKIKKDMEEHLAQISALKEEVRSQKTELASVGFLEEADPETLDTLQKATRKVKTMRLGQDDSTEGSRVDTVYFFPDVSSPMMLYSLPIVDEVGKMLQENDDYVVAIRGYAAPAGTMSNQMMISESRARYCAEYLNKNFGIAYDRMVIEWYGSQKKNESWLKSAYKDRGFNRAVELVTRSKTGQHVMPELSEDTRFGSPVNGLAEDYDYSQGYDTYIDPSIIPSNIPPDYGPSGTGSVRTPPPVKDADLQTDKKKKRNN